MQNDAFMKLMSAIEYELYIRKTREVKPVGYQPFQSTPIDDATMAEIEATMQHLEEVAQLKDEPLVWQDYNDHPEPLVPFVDKALISHEVPPISLDDAFKHVMDTRLLWRMVYVVCFLIGVIAGTLIVFSCVQW
jgi:hypothetical protein